MEWCGHELKYVEFYTLVTETCDGLCKHIFSCSYFSNESNDFSSFYHEYSYNQVIVKYCSLCGHKFGSLAYGKAVLLDMQHSDSPFTTRSEL